MTAFASLQDPSLSATALLGTSPVQPIVLDLREASNTSQEFCTFSSLATAQGFFDPGDILVYDNASVHFAVDTWEEIAAPFDAPEVISIPLPTYSPELNPIERCFQGDGGKLVNQRYAQFPFGHDENERPYQS